MSDDQTYQRPDRLLLLAEAPRALSEAASLIPVSPFLSQAPRGDGHPVLVLPGFTASDRSTRVLRRFLTGLGHDAHPWTLGQNRGPAMENLREDLAKRLEHVFYENNSRKVSLVGWSLGGVYARLLAHNFPDKIRQVITLGSPLGGNPKSTRAYPIAQRMSDRPLDSEELQDRRSLAGAPLPGVPSTSIFSKTDGIVPWQISVISQNDFSENIEVYGSHIGLGFNPSVLFAIADRLALPADEWAPFDRSGWRQLVYGQTQPETDIDRAA